MTPHQLRIAQQASREIDPTKVRSLLDELCHAMDGEREEKRQLHRDRGQDCREHPMPFPCD